MNSLPTHLLDELTRVYARAAVQAYLASGEENPQLAECSAQAIAQLSGERSAENRELRILTSAPRKKRQAACEPQQGKLALLEQ